MNVRTDKRKEAIPMSQHRRSGAHQARSEKKDQKMKGPNWSNDTIIVNGQAFAIIFPEK